MHPYLVLTSLLASLTTALTLSIAQSPPILQSSNLTTPTTTPDNFAKPTADWECRSGGSLHRPKFQDCGFAVLRLPRTATSGTFYTGSAADEFELPFVVTDGTCSVRIAFVEGGRWQETGSWHEVATEVAALWHGCRAAVVESWFIGATTTAGRRGKIGITFVYHDGNVDAA